MGTEFKRMQSRGKTEAEILAEDEVPLEREFIIASDTGKVWPADGVSSVSALPYLPPVDAATNQLPDEVRQAIAANLADPSTPEGAALAEAVAAGGGGSSAPLAYDPATGVYSVPDSSTISYDAATGAYATN